MERGGRLSSVASSLGLPEGDAARQRGIVMMKIVVLATAASLAMLSAAAGASGWQGSDRQISGRQVSNRQISTARCDQGLTHSVTDGVLARRIVASTPRTLSPAVRKRRPLWPLPKWIMIRGATNATSPDEGARPRLQGGLVCRRARRGAASSGGQRAGQTRRDAGQRPAADCEQGRLLRRFPGADRRQLWPCLRVVWTRRPEAD